MSHLYFPQKLEIHLYHNLNVNLHIQFRYPLVKQMLTFLYLNPNTISHKLIKHHLIGREFQWGILQLVSYQITHKVETIY